MVSLNQSHCLNRYSIFPRSESKSRLTDIINNILITIFQSKTSLSSDKNAWLKLRIKAGMLSANHKIYRYICIHKSRRRNSMSHYAIHMQYMSLCKIIK